jgi:hypothetical protein
MSGALENHVLPIHCPKCGARIDKTVGWLRGNSELVCPCGTTMHLEAGEVLQAVETLESALSRINRPAPVDPKTPV